MRRFWKTVSVVHDDHGWTVQLDGRPLKTPARNPLAVPGEALAQAVSTEWRDVEDRIEPQAMPLTGLANAAIDRISLDRPTFAAGLARYGEADLICYRADGPSVLVARQEEAWDPLLAWARRRYDVDFVTTAGLMHVAQPTATIEQLGHAIAALDAFRLAGLSPMVTTGGSLVAALAVLERAVEPQAAWHAVTVDDRWQAEQWGVDPEAEAGLANKRRDFLAGADFLDLLD